MREAGSRRRGTECTNTFSERERVHLYRSFLAPYCTTNEESPLPHCFSLVHIGGFETVRRRELCNTSDYSVQVNDSKHNKIDSFSVIIKECDE